MPSGIVAQPVRRQRLTRRLNERIFMGGDQRLPLSQLTVARNRICFSRVDDRRQAVIVSAVRLRCHPDPAQRGAGPRSCNPPFLIGNDRSFPLVRFLSVLRRFRTTKNCFPSLVIGALARARFAFSFARPREPPIQFCIARMLAKLAPVIMIELEVYAAGARDPNKSPQLDRQLEAVPGLRCEVDDNHDIVYLELDKPTVSFFKFWSIYLKLGLEPRFVGAIPPGLRPRSKTQLLSA
jgi:hypothetical protein